MDQALNATDIAIVGLLLISALWAFIRGFVRELLGVLAWAGAGIVTLYGFALARPYARQFIKMDWLADAVAGVVLFVVSLILFSVISGAISSQVRQSSLSAIDRSLGFLFGLARGAAIVCIAYLVLKEMVPAPQDRPAWVTSARSLPAIERGTAMLESLIPDSLRDRSSGFVDRARQEAEDAAAKKRALEMLTSPPARAPEPARTPAPSGQDQRELDRLIRQSGDKKQ